MSTVLTFRKPIQKNTADGGIRIGGDARVSVEFSGSAATIGDPKKSKITSLELFSTGLFLTQKGEDVASVNRITVGPGGKVTIDGVRALVALADLESLARFFTSGETEPKLVNALAKQKLEQVLAPAIVEALGENCDLVPGRDLCGDLGIPRKSAAPKP